MSFFFKDDEPWDQQDQIWDVIKAKLGIKFNIEPVYKYKYLKAKLTIKIFLLLLKQYG